MSENERSQVQAIGESNPKTWDDYERGCLATYRGGHHDAKELDAFQHGMRTVFNLLRNEFPPAEQVREWEAAQNCETATALFAEAERWKSDKEEIERLQKALEVATELIEKLTAKVERYRNPYGYSAPVKPAPKQIDFHTCQHEGCDEKRPDVPGPPDPKPYVCLKHRHLVRRPLP